MNGGSLSSKALLFLANGAADKVYDGKTYATLDSPALYGAPVGVSVSSGVATFADKNAGVGKVATLTGFTLSGANSANFSLFNRTTGTITPKVITVTGITAQDKVYDGGTSAGGIEFPGIISGDTVTSTGAFPDKNGGAGRTVNITGITLSGGDAVNYTLTNTTPTTAATITRKNITAINLSGGDAGNYKLTNTTPTTAATITRDIITVSVKPTNLTAITGHLADNVHKIEKMMQLSNVDGFFKVTPKESLMNVEGAMLKLPPEPLLKDIAP